MECLCQRAARIAIIEMATTCKRALEDALAAAPSPETRWRLTEAIKEIDNVSNEATR